ncbi:hypothetical protein ACLOJK_034493, partial [Asimina triloba]
TKNWCSITFNGGGDGSVHQPCGRKIRGGEIDGNKELVQIQQGRADDDHAPAGNNGVFPGSGNPQTADSRSEHPNSLRQQRWPSELQSIDAIR